MSLMDDIFDLRDFVKEDKGMVGALEALETAFYEAEKEVDELRLYKRVICDLKELLK